MIIRERKRLKVHLKRNKNHVIVMSVCMNTLNTFLVRLMNARVHHIILTLVR